jgi:hypothetical protein
MEIQVVVLSLIAGTVIASVMEGTLAHMAQISHALMNFIRHSKIKIVYI